MKYLIIGAGGTGGVTGYYMKKAGKDVTLIARGEHLKTIQEQGLTLEKMWDKTEETITIPATDMEHYTDHPDVIFVCVKGYSLDETIPFIKQIAKKTTIVIPVLNIYGTGGKMQKQLPELLETDASTSPQTSKNQADYSNTARSCVSYLVCVTKQNPDQN